MSVGGITVGLVFLLLFLCLAAVSFYSIPDCNAQRMDYTPRFFANVPEVQTGSASNVTETSATLSGTVNAHGLSTTAWFQYWIVNGPFRNTYSTQTIIGTGNTNVSIRVIQLLPGTTYYFRLVARNDAGEVYGNEMSFTTQHRKMPGPIDVIPPSGSIAINNGAYYTNSPTVTISLSATDNIGVAGYYLSDSDISPSLSTQGWKSVAPRTSCEENVSYTLRNDDGENMVYVWYKDTFGNISDSASDSIVVDTIAPTITITDPAHGPPYTTTDKTIHLSGNALDNTGVIDSVVWDNNRERDMREKATTHWTVPNISLWEGDNVITIKLPIPWVIPVQQQ